MYNTDLPQRAELPGTAQLVRSTLVALLVAAGLLVTVVLPAEYGVDPTGAGQLLGLKKMGEIKASASAPSAPTTVTAPMATPQTPVVPAASVAIASKSNQTVVTLKPGEAAEIKLEMVKGATVQYRWAAQGGTVVFDEHGEGSAVRVSVSYKKGKDAQQDEGTLEAAFDGQHGWYWKNRGKNPVTIELTTQGQYAAIKRVL